MLRRVPFPRRVRVTGALLVALIISGCATTPSPERGAAISLVGADNAKTLPDDFANFLEEAHAGAIRELASSPWGEDVEVTAGPAYFAASGRVCRPLTITRGEEVQNGLACRGESGWVKQRLLSRESMGEAW